MNIMHNFFLTVNTNMNIIHEEYSQIYSSILIFATLSLLLVLQKIFYRTISLETNHLESICQQKLFPARPGLDHLDQALRETVFVCTEIIRVCLVYHLYGKILSKGVKANYLF